MFFPAPPRPHGALVLAAVAILAVVTLPVHAATPGPGPGPGPAVVSLPEDVRQLLHDLRAIAPGAIITDEEKQTLAADLTALATGLVKPSAASVEQLADDLAAAAASGKLSRKVETLLARDLAAVFDRTTLDPTALRALVDEIRTILAAYGLDAADLQQFAADLETIIDAFQTDRVSTRQVVTLQSEGIPFGLLMNYGGHATLTTVQTDGRAAQAVLSIETNDLPPANPYTVAVIKHSDGSTLVLGTLKVHAGFPGIHLAARGRTDAAATIHPEAEILSRGAVVFGGLAGKGFPDGFDPADIDTLILTDSNGTERLAGSFVDATDLQQRTRLVNLRVDAGAADPGAAGAVSFRVKTTGTKSRNAFLLYVGGLPASAAVTLLADDAAVGTFTTTATGQLVIVEGDVPVPTSLVGRMLPVNALPAAVDLDTVSSLTLTNAAGNILATAGM